MKAKRAITILMIFTIIISCSRENNSNDLNETKTFEISKTEHKGCFIDNPMDTSKNALYMTGDSLYYTIENDTLVLYAIMNYNCCGLLNDSLVIENENVNIYIHDTCISGCICYCICEFEFEYYFVNFLGNNINFYVHLKGYEEDEYSLWDDLAYP